MALATSSGSLASWPARFKVEKLGYSDRKTSNVGQAAAQNFHRHAVRRGRSLFLSSLLISGYRGKLSTTQKTGFQRVKGRRRMVQADAKMFVPGFGEKSPEAKAADSLHNFFTFTALKIVLSQLQSYNPEAYKDLMDFAQRTPLKDGDDFLHQLMRESPQAKTLAMRILEVRSAYAEEDFEWDNVQKLSKKRMEESNTKVLREYLQQSSGIQ